MPLLIKHVGVLRKLWALVPSRFFGSLAQTFDGQCRRCRQHPTSARAQRNDSPLQGVEWVFIKNNTEAELAALLERAALSTTGNDAAAQSKISMRQIATGPGQCQQLRKGTAHQCTAIRCRTTDAVKI
jgi:hypothetical protein